MKAVLGLYRSNAFVRLATIFAALLIMVLPVLGVALHRVGQGLREDQGLLLGREQILGDVDRLLADLRDTAPARQALARVRPHPGELVSFVRGLERAAANAFIEQKITTSPGVVPAAENAYTSPVVRYRLALNGPWDKLEAYLRELARLPYLVRVETITMGTSPGGDLLQQGNIQVIAAVAVLDPGAPQPKESPLTPAVSPTPAPALDTSPSPAR